MGLDTVELVIEMEKHFGITIPDREAEKIMTVGGAYRIILSRLEFLGSRPCRSSAAFYELRRALTTTFGAERARVRPATAVAELLPLRTRLNDWPKLGARLNLSRIPELRRPVWLDYTLFIAYFVSAVVYVAAILSGASGLVRDGTLLMQVLVAFSLLVLGFAVGLTFVTGPFKRHLPTDCVTVRDLIRMSLGRKPDSLSGSEALKRWEPEAVWNDLTLLISRQLGVPLKDITEEKRFVQDFGAD